MSRRVVITGLGPVTPIGIGADVFHAAQLEGLSGVRPITRFDASEMTVRFAGEVDFNPSHWIEARELKRIDRYAQLALAAAALALEHAGLDPNNLEPDRVATAIGSGIGGMETWEAQSRIFVERGPSRLSPFFIPTMIANMGAAQVAMRYGFSGPSTTTVTACASGADAIGTAMRMIQHHEADVALAGGSEANVTAMSIGGFAAMRALSTRNANPSAASRPFSRDRDGFVVAEGAAVLVLESFEHAKARGANILAELIGFGRSSDAHHITEPHPEGRGSAGAMLNALRDANLAASRIGYLNAHGTSTPLGDRAETIAIKRVFADHAKRLAISSTKSMTGHTLGAAGAIEAVATVQALSSGFLPPTINLTEPDPDLDLDFIPLEARVKRVTHALSNSFAFGGHNTSLLFSIL
jgi:3-oxoacyl-[acyl-carrier-protein] synthase II